MDFPVDYFTGDGTSTSFQLSRIPASATSILVHIGGVKQVASTTDPAYYLDGSRLVFVSPPGAYSPIEVNYLGIAGQVNIPGVQSVTQDMLSLQLANTFVYQTTANGATASFTLNAPPVSANSLVVSANGVIQHDYSVNSNILTFGFTPPSGTFIRITSLALAQAGVPADGSVTSVKLGANLTLTGNTSFDGFSGNGARIRGDMTTTTFANRLAFQTSTTNGTSSMTLLPNGSGLNAFYRSYGNSDPTNASEMAVGVVGTSEVRLQSGTTGSGTYLPITFYTGGSERMRIDTSGRLLIGLSTSGSTTSRLQVTGGTTNATNLATSYSDAAVAFVPKSTSGFSLAVGSGTSDFPQLQVSANGAAAGALLLQPYGGGLLVNTSTQTGSTKMVVADSSGAGQIRAIHSTGSGFLINQDSAAGNVSLNNQDSAALLFNTNNSERMRIDSSGNVGIGTSTPGSYAYGLAIDNTNATNTGYVFNLLSGGSSWFKIGRLVASSTAIIQSGQNLALQPDSGNVGIGTSSPTTKTEIYGTAAASSIALRVTNTATDGYSSLWLGDSNGAFFRNGSTQTGYAGANSLNLGTVAAHNLGFITNNTERMRIDSSGRVTMPYQPAFYAMMNNVTFSDTRAITFEDVYVNVGGHYNSTNGRFTAPVAGTYMFSANFLKRSSSGRLKFTKNDTYYGSGSSQTYSGGVGAGEIPHAATIIITLAVNDYVNVVGQNDGGDIYGDSNSHNGFSGFLIG